MSTKEQRTRSTRIYTPTSYSSSYSGQSKEESFTPIQALDQSKAIEKRAAQQVQNVKNLAEAGRRQGQLDEVTLKGNQSIQKAQFDAQWKTFQGILSLTKTGLQLAEKAQDIKQEREEYKSLFDLSSVESVKTNNKIEEIGIDTFAVETNKEANDLTKTGTIEDKDIAQRLVENTHFNRLKDIKGDVLRAKVSHASYLQERLKEIPDDVKKNLSHSQYLALMAKLNGEFLIGSGLSDKRLRSQVIENLLPTIKQNSLNAASNLTANAIKIRQADAKLTAENNTSIYVKSGFDANELWSKVSKEYAFGGLGYNGHTKASNGAALEQLLKELAQEGPRGITLIKELRGIQKIEGQKGTELNKEFNQLFDKYQDLAEKKIVSDAQTKTALNNANLTKVKSDYEKNHNPQTRKAYIEYLRDNPSEENNKTLRELYQIPQDYNPLYSNEIGKLYYDDGIEPTKGVLDDLLESNKINQTEYDDWIKLTEEGQLQTKYKDLFEGIEDNVIDGMKRKDIKISPMGMAEIDIRASRAAKEIKRQVTLILVNNEERAKDPQSVEAIITGVTQKVLSRPEFTIDITESGQVSFAKPMVSLQSKVPEFAPGKQNFTSIETEALFGQGGLPLTMMQADEDRFLKLDLLKSDVNALKDGNEISQRTIRIAERLGLSPKAFIDGQMKAYGLTSYDTYIKLGAEAGQVKPQVPSEPVEGNLSAFQTGQQKTVYIGKELLDQGFTIWQHPNFGLDSGFDAQGSQLVKDDVMGNTAKNEGEYKSLSLPYSHNHKARLIWLDTYLTDNKERFGVSNTSLSSQGLVVEFH